MFKSSFQSTQERKQLEEIMSRRLAYMVYETEMKSDDVREIFLEEFPGEEEFYEIELSNLLD